MENRARIGGENGENIAQQGEGSTRDVKRTCNVTIKHGKKNVRTGGEEDENRGRTWYNSAGEYGISGGEDGLQSENRTRIGGEHNMTVWGLWGEHEISVRKREEEGQNRGRTLSMFSSKKRAMIGGKHGITGGGVIRKRTAEDITRIWDNRGTTGGEHGENRG